MQCAAGARVYPLRPPSKRLIDQRPTDAAVGAGDQDRLLLKFHFVLLSKLSVSNWYYASPPGQDTWANPNNGVKTLTAICGSAFLSVRKLNHLPHEKMQELYSEMRTSLS